MKDTAIKAWYQQMFPTDELGTELKHDATFGGLFAALADDEDVYDFLGVGDSIVRERVFGKLAEIRSVPYEHIYRLWLKI